jgi:hypothetical protein
MQTLRLVTTYRLAPRLCLPSLRPSERRYFSTSQRRLAVPQIPEIIQKSPVFQKLAKHEDALEAIVKMGEVLKNSGVYILCSIA